MWIRRRVGMAARSLKKGQSSSGAGFVRQRMNSDRLESVLEIPDELKHRMVEVILLPYDGEPATAEDQNIENSPLYRFAGAWAGEALVKEDEGNYESREDLK